MSQYQLHHRNAEVRWEASLLADTTTIGEFDLEFQIGRPCLILVVSGGVRVYTLAKRSPNFLSEDQQLALLSDQLLKSIPGSRIAAMGTLTADFVKGPLVFKINGKGVAFVYMYPESAGCIYLFKATRIIDQATGHKCEYFLDIAPIFSPGGEFELSEDGLSGFCHYVALAIAKASQMV